MSDFATWKKRSPLIAKWVVFTPALNRLLQAAYKAGERQGRKDAEALATRSIVLREALDVVQKRVDDFAATKGECK